MVRLILLKPTAMEDRYLQHMAPFQARLSRNEPFRAFLHLFEPQPEPNARPKSKKQPETRPQKTREGVDCAEQDSLNFQTVSASTFSINKPHKRPPTPRDSFAHEQKVTISDQKLPICFCKPQTQPNSQHGFTIRSPLVNIISMLLVKKQQSIHYLTAKTSKPETKAEPKTQPEKLCYSKHSLPRKTNKNNKPNPNPLHKQAVQQHFSCPL